MVCMKGLTDILSPKTQDHHETSMVLRFRVILNVMVGMRVKVRDRIRILILILTLILTVNMLIPVTFWPKPKWFFLKSYQVKKMLNSLVPVSTQLPGLSGNILLPTVRYSHVGACSYHFQLQGTTDKVYPCWFSIVKTVYWFDWKHYIIIVMQFMLYCFTWTQLSIYMRFTGVVLEGATTLQLRNLTPLLGNN